MESSLLDRNLNEDSYDLYIDNIINIFRLSCKESSIIFDLKLRDSKCVIKLSIVNQQGEREEYNDTTLKCDDVFYNNFLEVLVKRFLANTKVVTKDIVDFDDDPLVTFRLITENNDLFSIDGLTYEEAKKLLEFENCKEGKDKLVVTHSNAGIGNVLIFILMITILILTFILIVMIFK